MFNKEYEAMQLSKLREVQLERLRWSVKHAYDNVPFYRQSFDAAGFKPEQIKSLDDLRRVPFLMKQNMRDAYPFGLFAVPMEKVVRIHSSSGTTGNATVVGLYQKRHRDMGGGDGANDRLRGRILEGRRPGRLRLRTLHRRARGALRGRKDRGPPWSRSRAATRSASSC